LLGARVHIDPVTVDNAWVAVQEVPDEKGNFKSGFMELARLSQKQQLKIFYIDVGQGDASLVEAENATVIIDAGPNSGFHKYLKRRFAALRRADKAVNLPERDVMFIDAVFISHFDADHYQGIVSVLKNKKFKFGTVYHNGLPRYGHSGDMDLDLGTLIQHNDGTRSISTDFTDIESAKTLRASGKFNTKKGNRNKSWQFLDALITAHGEGRVKKVKRLVARDQGNTDVITIGDLNFEVLGPLTTKKTGVIRLPAFPDPHNVTGTNPHPAPSESHTVNGNSIVLRLSFGNQRFLFGGDLNQPAQRYLRERYGTHFDQFTAGVNKACHHGSSDFDVHYLKDVAPSATVFSSGDDGSYDHPLPDAMGAAAKYSTGEFPLVFSTELARDTHLSTGKITFGHINARSNGDIVVMAQKKEKVSSKNPWHTFDVPYDGPFGDHS
jgi:beta-lactamase superfamily II metal-dependent hydrolase